MILIVCIHCVSISKVSATNSYCPNAAEPSFAE